MHKCMDVCNVKRNEKRTSFLFHALQDLYFEFKMLKVIVESIRVSDLHFLY